MSLASFNAFAVAFTLVTLSYNSINDMKIFASFTNIVHLDLSHNKITEINGVNKLNSIKVKFKKKDIKFKL
jgi:Leucine-rich repeat (LRR) protein